MVIGLHTCFICGHLTDRKPVLIPRRDWKYNISTHTYPIQEIWVCDAHMEEGGQICAVGGPLTATFFLVNRFEEKQIIEALKAYKKIYQRFPSKFQAVDLPDPITLKKSLNCGKVKPSEHEWDLNWFN